MTVEKLAKTIAGRVGEKLGCDDEKIAVMAYGLIGLFQFAVILCACVVIGLIFGFFIEAMIIFWGVGIIRRSTGGAHSRNFYCCLFTSIVFICFFAWVCKQMSVYSSSIYFYEPYLPIYAAAFAAVYKEAPVESPNKPINREKRFRLRKAAFITIGIFAIVSICECAISVTGGMEGNFYHISLPLTICVLWQTFLILPAGKMFIDLIDRIFIKQR